MNKKLITIFIFLLFFIFLNSSISANENIKLNKFKNSTVTIVLSAADYKAITRLGDLILNKKFAQYNKENIWRKAKLITVFGVHKINFKLHGRTPVNEHKVGGVWSLGIKLKGQDAIMNARRFNLLVGQRLLPKHHVPAKFGKALNLIHQQSIPIHWQFNSTSKIPAFFEYRFNDEFMEFSTNPEMKMFKSPGTNYAPEQSMIYTGYYIAPAEQYEYKNLKSLFETIFKEENMDPDFNYQISERYYQINNHIIENRIKNLEFYFDKKYLARFEAVRAILGLDGHGSSNDNLHVFFNKTNGKFYPALTRDHNIERLNLNLNNYNKKIEENFLFKPSLEKITDYYLKDIRLYLFAAISQNDILRQEKYKEIYNILNGDLIKNLSLSSEQKKLINQNSKELLEYLNISDPKVLINTNDKITKIEIKPRSMSGLAFENLELVGSSKITGISWGYKDNKKKYVINEKKFGKNKSNINLAIELKKFVLFSSLTKELTPFDLDYFIEIQHKSNKESKQLKYKIINTITGKEVLSEKLILKKTSVNENSQHNKIYLINPINTFLNRYRKLNISLEDQFVIFPPGNHIINSNFILPDGYGLKLMPGTELEINNGSSIFSSCGLIAEGTEKEKIKIFSDNKEAPFGTFAIQGCNDEKVIIKNMEVYNGSEAWVKGAFYSGALSIHNINSIEIDNLKIFNSKRDDGINIKNCINVKIKNSEFLDNAYDQVDLDKCDGIVENSTFKASLISKKGGDGLDLSFSNIIAFNNKFLQTKDKGVSVGEKSNLISVNNEFIKNNIGIAIKDLSKVISIKDYMDQNNLNFSLYQKKRVFGGGSLYANYIDKKKLHLDENSTANEISNIFEIGDLKNLEVNKTKEIVKKYFKKINF